MPDEQSKLLELLSRLNFAERYYGQFEKRRDRPRNSDLTQQQFQDALNSTGIAFKYHKSEKFFGHKESAKGIEIGLNVKLLRSTAEFILVCRPGSEHIGDVYAVLALLQKRLKDPNYEHTPPYPTLPFSNESEMVEVVQFGVSLYKEVREAVLAHDGWEK